MNQANYFDSNRVLSDNYWNGSYYEQKKESLDSSSADVPQATSNSPDAAASHAIRETLSTQLQKAKQQIEDLQARLMQSEMEKIALMSNFQYLMRNNASLSLTNQKLFEENQQLKEKLCTVTNKNNH